MVRKAKLDKQTRRKVHKDNIKKKTKERRERRKRNKELINK